MIDVREREERWDIVVNSSALQIYVRGFGVIRDLQLQRIIIIHGTGKIAQWAKFLAHKDENQSSISKMCINDKQGRACL